MAFTGSNPISIGDPTKKSHYDTLWDNTDYVLDYVKGDDGQGSGATGHIHDDTDGTKVLFTNLNFTSSNLTSIATRNFTDLGFTSSNLTSIVTRNFSDLTGYLHAPNHVDGTDDIQDATGAVTARKGLMTAIMAEVVQHMRADLVANVTLTTSPNYYDFGATKFHGVLAFYGYVRSSGPGTFDELNDGDSQWVIISTTESQALTFTAVDNAAAHALNFKTLAVGEFQKVQIKSDLNGTVVYGFLISIDDGSNSQID